MRTTIQDTFTAAAEIKAGAPIQVERNTFRWTAPDGALTYRLATCLPWAVTITHAAFPPFGSSKSG